MSEQIDVAKDAADKHAGMVLYYSHNAKKYLTSKDYKTSEMM